MDEILEEKIIELIEQKKEYKNIKLLLGFLINKYFKSGFDLNMLLTKLENNFKPDNEIFILTSLYIDNIIIGD